jgi:hypothetical protein
VAVAETTEVRVVPDARSISSSRATRARLGDRRGLGAKATSGSGADHDIDDDTLIVAERFRLVGRLS